MGMQVQLAGVTNGQFTATQGLSFTQDLADDVGSWVELVYDMIE